MDTLQLLGRFGHADPPDDTTVDAAVSAVMAAAASERPNSARLVGSRRSRWSRPKRRAVFVAAAVAAVAVPAAAAAAVISANVGGPPFGKPGVTAKNPDRQYLNLDSPGIVPVVRQLTTTVPLPPGASWQPLLDRFPYSAAKGHGSRATIEQRAGLGAEVEGYASCQWEETWLAAHRAGNTVEAKKAADVLSQVPRWHYYVEDATPGVLPALRRIGSAAEHGNAGPVAYDYNVNCSSHPTQ